MIGLSPRLWYILYISLFTDPTIWRWQSELLTATLIKTKNIQGVPGGKISILGGHSKQKIVPAHVSCCKRFPRSISLYSSKIVDKKEKLLFLIPVFNVQVTKLMQFT
jgi:hypothetical protein